MKAGDILITIEAVLCLYIVKLMFISLPFKQIRLLLDRLSKTRTNSSDDICRTTRVLTALVRAQRLIFWRRSFCLVNAFTLHWMLKRRGLPSSIHLGVHKKDSALTAHAWVESQGLALIGSELKDQYSRIASFN